MILSGVSRPTRRGVLFNNTKPKKLQLSRHYKNIRLNICLHKISVYYWMSFAEERGFELYSGLFSLSSEQSLSLIKIDDGLIHRPSAIWSINYMNWELNNVESWLINSTRKESQDVIPNTSIEYDKSFFLTVSKMSYGRESTFGQDLLTVPDQLLDDPPTHMLTIHSLQGSWTLKNRNLIFALIDAYQKTQLLKRNLSTEALKSVKMEHYSVTPVKLRSLSAVSGGSTGTPSTPLLGSAVAAATATPSPVSKLQSSVAANMLHKLISESGSNATVYTEEVLLIFIFIYVNMIN
ncbi:Protein KIAA0100 [Nymphon striatum]|nr:Protein KIAA0100 [Nymphon striatum]